MGNINPHKSEHGKHPQVWGRDPTRTGWKPSAPGASFQEGLGVWLLGGQPRECGSSPVAPASWGLHLGGYGMLKKPLIPPVLLLKPRVV